MAKKINAAIFAIAFFLFLAFSAAKGGVSSAKAVDVYAARENHVSEYAPTAGAATELDADFDDYFCIPTAGVETTLSRMVKF
ncbi:hypothetical protein SAMN06296386_10299 [Lachnospiraceae bacterium]|nr:hypothetical protein SAMN06296386_10299 [Lachnospiraceae bacterium]